MDEDHQIMFEREEPHLVEEVFTNWDQYNDEETVAYQRWHHTTNR